jgi:hypothetical protein
LEFSFVSSPPPDFQNYVKPKDSMTLLIDKDQKQLLSIKIASYPDDPTDAMNLTLEFDGGVGDVAGAVGQAAEGVSK